MKREEKETEKASKDTVNLTLITSLTQPYMLVYSIVLLIDLCK